MSVSGVRRAGERGVVLDVDVDPAAAAIAVRRLAESADLPLTDVVPGAVTVLVVAPDAAALARFLEALPQLVVDEVAPATGHVIEVAVHYDGVDLTAVAEATGMEVAALIRLHSEVIYRAGFTGFAPGFAYLNGLDPRLRLPRRASPRPAVPAGAVAIADRYTAVYPRASPGGWHLLGTTDAVIFDPHRRSPALIAPGTCVRFRPA